MRIFSIDEPEGRKNPIRSAEYSFCPLMECSIYKEIEGCPYQVFIRVDFTTTRLVAGTRASRDLGRIDLPGELLKCLPFPQPSIASLVTVYIEPSSTNTHWVDEFTSNITISFGRVSTVLIDGTAFSTCPTVEIVITGREIRRAAIANAAGEKRMLRDVVDVCPRDYVDWASPSGSSNREQIRDQFFQELSRLSNSMTP